MLRKSGPLKFSGKGPSTEVFYVGLFETGVGGKVLRPGSSHSKIWFAVEKSPGYWLTGSSE